MNINLIELNTKGKVNFEGCPNLEAYISDYIRGFKNVIVKGSIIDNGTEEYEIELFIKGFVILKSAVSNEDVDYKIDVKYNDFIKNLVENYKNSTNTLDILPIIWENILLEIPIRAVNSHDTFEKTSGNGWELIGEEEKN